MVATPHCRPEEGAHRKVAGRARRLLGDGARRRHGPATPADHMEGRRPGGKARRRQPPGAPHVPPLRVGLGPPWPEGLPPSQPCPPDGLHTATTPTGEGVGTEAAVAAEARADIAQMDCARSPRLRRSGTRPGARAENASSGGHPTVPSGPSRRGSSDRPTGMWRAPSKRPSGYRPPRPERA